MKRLFGLTVCIMTAASFVVSAQGATWNVPAAFLSDAVTSAGPGDTIIITDSGTETSAIYISTPSLTIKAAAGQTPILTNDVNLNPGAQGGQFGSNDGGRIQMGDGVVDPGNWFISADYTTGTFTLENLYIAATEEVIKETSDDGITSTMVLNMNDIDINYSGTRYSNAIWWRRGGNINMNRVTMRNVDAGGCIRVGVGGYNCTFNLSNCELLAIDSESGGGFNNIQAAYPILVADQCVMRGARAVNLAEGGSSVTITRSALIAMGNSTLRTDLTYDAAGWNWYRLEGFEQAASLFVSGFSLCPTPQSHQDAYAQGPGRNPAWSMDYWTTEEVRPTDVYVDHCDLISSGSAVLICDYETTNRHVTITNSNLIALNTDPVVTATLNAFDSLTIDHCNVHNMGTGPRWGGETTEIAAGVTNDYDLDPGYVDWEAYNFAYSDSTLATGDDSGGAVGIAASLVGQVPVELSTFTLQ
jgi:hypothetical protein